MEADPWASPSPWAEPEADASTSAAGATSLSGSGSASATTPALPSFSVSGAGALRSASEDDYAATAPWGSSSSDSAPASASPTKAFGATLARRESDSSSGPKTPSTSGLEPPQWGDVVPESANAGASTSLAGGFPPADQHDASADAGQRTPPASARSVYSTASFVSARDEASSTQTRTTPATTAPPSAGDSEASGWAPVGSPGLGFGSSAAAPAGSSPSAESPAAAAPWGSDAGPSTFGAGASDSLGIAESGPSRLTPVSAGWGPTGSSALPVDDALEDESPWGPPPPRAPEQSSEPSSTDVSQSMSSDALQAAIQRKIDPEHAPPAGAEKGKKPPDIVVPPLSSGDKAEGSGASTPRDAQSAASQASQQSQSQATWLARLRATQKGSTSPQLGRTSLEAERASTSAGGARKSTEEAAKKPGFVQTSKQEPPKGAAGVISSLIASAKKGIAPPAVVSAADEEDDEPPAPQTGTTTSFASNPDSARDLLSFDDEAEKNARAAAAASKQRADADAGEEKASVVSRWFGRWGKRGGEDAPPHAQAGVSEESYADRLEGAQGHLSQADLEWLDKNAPQVHSAGATQNSPAGALDEAFQPRAPSLNVQPVQKTERSMSNGSSSMGSPLDNWLARAPRSASGAQFAQQGPPRPVTIGQAPGAAGSSSTNGPRGPSMVGSLRPGAPPGSARISSAGSTSAFGDFQSETAFSDFSPAPASAARMQQSLSQPPRGPPLGASQQARMGSSQGAPARGYNDQGLRTPASAIAAEFSPTPSSSGFGSPTGQLIGRKGDIKPPGTMEHRSRFAGSFDPYLSADPFESGKADIVDEDFGKDYRDDEYDEDDDGVLGRPVAGYRDDPSSDDPLPMPSRSGLPPRTAAQPARQAPAPATQRAPQPVADLLGDMHIGDSAPAPPNGRASQPTANLLDDFLSASHDLTKPQAQGARPQPQTTTAPRAPTAPQGVSLSRTASSGSNGQPAPSAALTNRGGPLLAAPPGQTRAGGLLPPPPSGRGAKAGNLLGGQQQTRTAADAAAAQKKPANGPSQGKGMTADDLSFFETL